MILYKELLFQLKTSDLDYNGNLKPFAILDFFQEIAGYHAEEIGIGKKGFQDTKNAWIILRSKYEVISSPKEHDEITVVTWPKPSGRADFNREYMIKNKHGQIIVKGTSKWVVMNLETRRLQRGDSINYNGEFFQLQLYEEDLEKLEISDELSFVDCDEYIVKNSDIDSNGHMNNAKFGEIILNSFDKLGYIRSLEVNYINEARLHDKINTKVAKESINYYFIGYIGDRVSFKAKLIMEEIQ